MIRNLCSVFRVHGPAQDPEPKAKAKGNDRAGNRRSEAAVAPVRRNRETEKGIAGKGRVPKLERKAGHRSKGKQISQGRKIDEDRGAPKEPL